MNIVLDTNVLVSGLLAPFGSSGEIIHMILAGKLVLSLDARILLEYQEVLHRLRSALAQVAVELLGAEAVGVAGDHDGGFRCAEYGTVPEGRVTVSGFDHWPGRRPDTQAAQSTSGADDR